MAIGIPLTLAESARQVTALAVSDSVALPASDAVNLFINQYGIPIRLTEVAMQAVSQAAGEVLPLTCVDLPSIFAVLSVSDNLTGGVSDVLAADPPILKAATDSLLIGLSEAVPTIDKTVSSIFSLSASDSATLASTEGGLHLGVSMAVSDAVLLGQSIVGFGEDVSIFGFVPQQFVSISVVDDCVVRVLTPSFPVTPKSAFDSVQLGLSEPGDFAQGFGVVDSAVGAVSESLPTIVLTPPRVDLSVADSLAAPLTESAPIISVLKWDISVFPLESLTLQAIDVTSVAVTFQPSDAVTLTAQESTLLAQSLARAETLAGQCAEASRIFLTFSTSDSVAVGATDAMPLFVNSIVFNVTDSAAVQESEAAPTFQSPLPILASDSAKLGLTDPQPLINSMVVASDSLKLSMNDAASLVLRFLAVTDALGLSATDAASIFSNFIAVNTTDSLRVQAADIVTLVQQLLTQLSVSESVAMQAMENPDIGVTQATEEILTIVLGDLAGLLQSLFPSDSLAYQIDSEDANIINPFVINSELTVFDSLRNVLIESAGGQPTLLSFFTIDESAIGVDDVALQEQLVLPETVDFQNETSFASMSDPQSYQTVSSKFW